MTVKPKEFEDDGIYNINDIINYNVYSFRGSQLEQDELFQIGYLGYLQAKKNYDPSMGKMTLLYASKYIRGAIYHAVMKERLISSTKVTMIDDLQGEYKDIDTDYYLNNSATKFKVAKALSCIDQEKDLRRKEKLQRNIDKVRAVLHLLPEEEADILYEYYLSPKNKSLLEMARKKGVTKQRIHQIKAKGLDLLKDILGEDFLEKNT